MLSFLAVVAVLAFAWWVSLDALDWAYRRRQPNRQRGGGFEALIGQWRECNVPAETRWALDARNLGALTARYAQMKEMTYRPNGATTGATDLSFEEALISMALGEAETDVAKAHRGLEAVRRLRRPSREHLKPNQQAVLDLIEARLRLVLAEAGGDSRQRELALACLDRAEQLAPQSGGPANPSNV